jgi:hypothetical protein
MPGKSIAAAALLVGALTVGGGVALAAGVTNTTPGKGPSVASAHRKADSEMSEPTETTETTETTEPTETTETTETTQVSETSTTVGNPGNHETCTQDNHGCAVSQVARDRSDPSHHADNVRTAAHDRSTLPAGAQH